MEKRLSESDRKLLLQGYRAKGIADPVVELAGKDLEYGLSKEMVELYIVPSIREANAKAMSEAIHTGASPKLVKKMKRLDEYQLRLTLAELKGGMSEDNIISVISKNATAHDMEQIFSKIKEDMSHARPDRPEEAEQLETAVENIKVPVSADTEEIVRAMEPVFERFAKEIKEAVKPEQKSLDEVAGMVRNWEMRMTEEGSQAAEKKLNGELDRLERQVEELKRDLAASAGVIKGKEEEISKLREEMLIMKESQERETGKPAGQQRPDWAEVRADAAYSEEKEQMARPAEHIVSGSRHAMLRTPDGTMIPVHIERADTRKHKGVAAIATRMFKGTPSQESLLSMLLTGGLDKDQLMEIKRAKECHFSDQELKDLIECGLPAETMSGIIDVVISDKGVQ